MSPTILHVNSLDEAISEIGKVKANPVGVQIMALKAVHRLVKFEAVDPKTANIVKQEMLSRGGDVAVSEKVAQFEKTKTDIIIMGTLAQYIRLIKKLRNQPFGECLKIADALQSLLFKDFDVAAASVW
jgi:dihydropteroate synthase